MDIRAYFQKLREAQSAIPSECVVMVSTDTPDGGKAGRMVEVGREVAAHMVVDGRGRLATDAEARAFRADMTELIYKAKAEQNAGKVQLTVMSPDQLRAIRQSIMDNP